MHDKSRIKPEVGGQRPEARGIGRVGNWSRGSFRMILLDTNIVIAFFNGNKSVLKEISEQIDSIALSVLVVAELDYGAIVTGNIKHFENIEGLKVETWPTW